MNLNDTFGALLVGAFVTMLLYGITTLQTYFYYYYYPKDSAGVKSLVATVWILDTLHVVFMCHAIYYYLITNFGHPAALAIANWSLISSMTVNVVIAFIVQCFFTRRIHFISPPNKRWWISGIIGFTVAAHFVLGLETVTFIYIKKQFSRLQEMSLIAAVPFGIFVVLSDVFIAAALCILLDSNRTDYRDTNNIINKLIVFSINRCILISIVAVVELVLFMALPHALYSFAVDFLVGKLYANSLLAALNARMSLRGEGGDLDGSDLLTSFNVATIPHIRLETTGVIRGEELTSTDDRTLNEDGKPPVITGTSHVTSTTTRRSGTSLDV